MSQHTISAIVAVLLGIIGVAVVSILVSNHSQTGSVLGAGGSALGNMISCALSPITGGSCKSLIPNVTSTIHFGV